MITPLVVLTSALLKPLVNATRSGDGQAGLGSDEPVGLGVLDQSVFSHNLIYWLPLTLGWGLLAGYPDPAHAAIDLSSGFWSTTFNCGEQTQSTAGWVSCDGLGKYGGWTASPGNVEEQITSTANMASGAGGRGQRHWIGAGRNNNSGSISFCLTTPQSELWIRYYTRWQAGYFMSGQQSQKMIYSDDAAGRPYIDLYGADGMRIVTNSSIFQTTAGVWNTIMRGSVSDGNWHEFQFHLKANGAAGGADLWVDGANVLSVTGFDWGSITNWQCFKYPENVDSNATGLMMHQDIDELAVSTTGRIPPLNIGNRDVPPAKPRNLRSR